MTGAAEREATALRVAACYAGRCAARYPGLGDRDELLSAALVAAARALSGWREDGGASFATYCTALILRAVAKQLRRAGREQARAVVSLDEPHEVPLQLRAGVNVEATALARIRAANLHAAMERLPERERSVITGHIWAEETFGAAATRLGVSESRAWQLWRQGLKRLRQQVEEE